MTGLFPSAREGALGSGSVNESQLPDGNAWTEWLRTFDVVDHFARLLPARVLRDFVERG